MSLISDKNNKKNMITEKFSNTIFYKKKKQTMQIKIIIFAYVKLQTKD